MNDVLSKNDLRKSGLSNRAIAARCRPGGPWRQLLPGVVLLKNTYPTRTERLKAVQTYAGDQAIITGIDALREQGANLKEPDLIHVLQGPNQRRHGQGIRFERTTRQPRTITKNGLKLAEPNRAAVDATRHEPDLIKALHILGAALNAGLCTIEKLNQELEEATKRGTATTRKALKTLTHQYSTGSFPSMSRT